MHFSRMGSYEDHEVPVIVRGEGAYVWDQHGKRYLDGLAGLFTSQIGHGRTELAEAGAKQAGHARLLPALDLRPPPRHRAGRAGGDLRPRRPQPGLLHHRRLRGGRVGLEAGPPVLPDDRAAAADEGDQPLHRLPRHVHGRAVHHRHPRPAHAVRAAGARRDQGAQHELLPGRALRRRRGGVRPVGRRRDRAGHRAGGLRHRGRRLPRAGAERRRVLPAAARLLRAGARDLRPPRRAARLRRGDLRLRPPRPLVRRPALRLPARHHHGGQGPDLGLRAARRHDRLGPARWSPSSARGVVPARVHVRRAPGQLRGGAGQPRRLRGRADPAARAGDGAGLPRRARGALRPADRGQRARGRVLLRDRARQGQGDPPLLRRRGVRAPAARLPVRRAVRGRAHLPGRRPRRPGGAALARRSSAARRRSTSSPPRCARCSPRRGAGCSAGRPHRATSGSPSGGRPSRSRCRRARRSPRTSTSTSASSAPGSPACGRRTRWRWPTPRCASSCSSARWPGSGPRAATAAGARRCSPPPTPRWPAGTGSTPCGRCAGPCRRRSTSSGASAASEGIDCHFAKGGSVDLVRSEAQRARALAEVDEARSLGFGEDDLRWLGPDETRDVDRC